MTISAVTTQSSLKPKKVKTEKFVLPALHEKQREVFQDPARFKVIVAGRRWGKTRLAVVAALYTALKGGNVWWIAPTYPVANIGWRLLKQLSTQASDARVRESDRTIFFERNNGMIASKSADNPVGLRGEGLDLVILEEAAFLPISIWEEEISPALADRKGGAYFISTPHGLHNLLAYVWEKAGSGEEGWKRWRFTTFDNPFIDKKEIERARESLPYHAFMQEFMAEFIDSANTVASPEWFKIVDAYPQDCRMVRFWDLAASEAKRGKDPDYTVGTLMGEKDGVFYIIDVIRGRWGPNSVEDVIYQTARADGISVTVGFEQEIGAASRIFYSHIMKRLAGFHVVRSLPKGRKLERAMPFLSQAEAGNVRLVRGPWNREWLREITGIPYTKHDDQLDSAAGAFHSLLRIKRRALYTW